MSIRIDHIHSGSKTIVFIAGRLTSTAITQLQQACNPISGALVMDLSNLLFADDEGIKTIRTFVKNGAQVHGASPFVALLLEEAQDQERGAPISKPI